MNLLKVAQILATAIPIIHALVNVVEQTMGGQAGQGAAKLDQVLTMVGPVLEMLGATPADTSALSPLVRSVIAGIVAASNAAGTFKSPATKS